MRNIFDQYKHHENRLTHALATILYEDADLLKKFIKKFSLLQPAAYSRLNIIEQSLPGLPEASEDEILSRGLPDAIIHDMGNWALLIESKIAARLDLAQLRRHQQTISRYGFKKIVGIAITTEKTAQSIKGWKFITWPEIYSWANDEKSEWAMHMVKYFNVAENKMIKDDEYLKKGSLTEFAGFNFDPYSYIDAKRRLRLLSGKIRDNKSFISSMRLDDTSGRKSITENSRIWDYISFKPLGRKLAFNAYPHCTLAVGESFCEASVTFPNGMKKGLIKKLTSSGWDDFENSVNEARKSIHKAMGDTSGYMPYIRIVQRRYPSQKSDPFIDGIMEVDLRVISGEKKKPKSPKIQSQIHWFRAIYDLLVEKKGNVQFQIGVRFYYDTCTQVKTKNADVLFTDTWKALRKFTAKVIDSE